MCELENECSNQIVVQSPNLFCIWYNQPYLLVLCPIGVCFKLMCGFVTLFLVILLSRNQNQLFQVFLFPLLLVGWCTANKRVRMCGSHQLYNWLTSLAFDHYIHNSSWWWERKKERKKEAEKREYRKESKEHWFIWITTQQGLFVVSLDHWEKGAGGTRETWFNMVNISI